MHAHLDKIHTFFAIVDSGSFTRAASNLGLSRAMVSLHIKSLEQLLGVTLLVRNTRSLALTGHGQQFYQDFKLIFADIDRAVSRVATEHHSLSGELRITSTWEYGQQFLMPLVSEFCQRHPLLKLNYSVGASLDDLVTNKLDVAIRLGALRDSSLKSRRLAGYAILLVASPALVNRFHPQDLQEVSALPWIHNSNLTHPGRWTFRGADNRLSELKSDAAYTANSAQIVRQMVLAGMGVAVLPEWLVREDIAAGRLQHLFKAWQLPDQPVSAVFSGQGEMQRKNRLFIDFLSQKLSIQPG